MSPVARWPTAVDYQTALQVPALCFSDADLKRADVATDALGLPMAATGNVAVVFRVEMEHGAYALRCFTRRGSVDSVAHRYEVLKTYLEQHDVAALHPSEFREGAITVHDVSYPIVLMPWVPGVQLHQYIERNLHDASALTALAEKWRRLMRQLTTARFAHGDLSDGNVLVDPSGALHLIDYDASYVPALESLPSNEIGKPNYQHPDRLNQNGDAYGYYAENLDAFSALVIYLSLRALADEPDRWERYHNGENLIFERSDYEQPGSTPIWGDLKYSVDTEVRLLTEVLEGYCLSAVEELPNLEDALQGKLPAQRRSAAATVRANADRPAVPPNAEEAAEEEPTPPARPRVAIPSYVPVFAGVAVVMLLAVGIAFFWFSGADVSVSTMPSTVTATYDGAAVDPAALTGFYTGETVLDDGTSEAIMLTIDEPVVSYADRAARFRYSLNSMLYQVGGAGRYDMRTGEIALDDRYVLRVAGAGADALALESTTRTAGRPILRVTKAKKSYE